MKNLVSLIFCLYTFCLHAQSFDEYIAKASSSYDDKNHQESANAFKAAFEIKEGNFGQYYDAACSWALSGDTLYAIQYLALAAQKGWRNLKHLKTDKDLITLRTLSGWNDILTMVQKNLTVYEKDFNKPLQAELEKIYVRDQTLRQLYRDAEDKFGKDSDEMIYFWELMSEQDHANEEEVVNIIEEHGWVGTNLVGGQANMALWLVIQHAPIEIQEKYLPLLKESVLKGQSSGSHLALLVDRILMRNGKPQIYGSQITYDEDTGREKIYKIKDPEYVNQRRKEVGLGPIQDYVKRWGIVWTIEQKE